MPFFLHRGHGFSSSHFSFADAHALQACETRPGPGRSFWICLLICLPWSSCLAACRLRRSLWPDELGGLVDGRKGEKNTFARTALDRLCIETVYLGCL